MLISKSFQKSARPPVVLWGPRVRRGPSTTAPAGPTVTVTKAGVPPPRLKALSQRLASQLFTHSLLKGHSKIQLSPKGTIFLPLYTHVATFRGLNFKRNSVPPQGLARTVTCNIVAGVEQLSRGTGTPTPPRRSQRPPAGTHSHSHAHTQPHPPALT